MVTNRKWQLNYFSFSFLFAWLGAAVAAAAANAVGPAAGAAAVPASVAAVVTAATTAAAGHAKVPIQTVGASPFSDAPLRLQLFLTNGGKQCGPVSSSACLDTAQPVFNCF